MSTYLNLVRWTAAFAVVLYHFRDKHFGPDSLTRHFPSNGHGYVIVFFVISGFVVSMASETKTAKAFMIDRAVRIYIVAIPVLVLLAVLSVWMPGVAKADYAQAVSRPLSTFLWNAIFLSQSWSLDVAPFADGPFWSLSYEVMYYVLFGVFTYIEGPLRWITTAIVALVAGPKIMILLPCWLAGVAAYKWRNSILLPAWTTWLTCLGVPIVFAGSFHFGLKDAANTLSDHIGFNGTASEGFVRSWIVALAFAIHLWAVCQINMRLPPAISSVARHLADASFSLYLTHLPTLYVVASAWGADQSDVFVVTALITVLAVAFTFSYLTEQKRHTVIKFIKNARLRHQLLNA
jgi:peptidoglycan/LPS O-acetylase OafA/YrhL